MSAPSKHLRPASLRVLMRRLRQHAPLAAPVRLVQKAGVRCQGEYVLGYAAHRQPWRKGKRGKPVSFRIVIDSRLPLGEKWEVVIHEWAHCLDRGTRHKPPKDCHDDRWGQHFAKAFRAGMTL